MSNFTFLKTSWPQLAADALRTESLALLDPRASCFYARRTLELAVQWLYESDETLKWPYDDSLSALIHEQSFKDLAGPAIFAKCRLVKDLGNQAVHSNRSIKQADSEQAVKELFHILYWLARTYSAVGTLPTADIAFDPSLLSAGAKRAAAQRATTQQEMQKLQAELEARDAAMRAQAKALEDSSKTADELDAEINKLRAEIASIKQQNAATPDTHDYSEAQTRDFFIDLLLHESGWPLDNPEDREYQVAGMPNNKGIGFVDYVLWGDDGLPLAVVEAKRTKKDARIGRQQAALYADCLQKQFDRRPIIFYTNGYEHWLWDDTNYPPRPVAGFYKKDELELLIQRRNSGRAHASLAINTTIAERPYQHLAIRAICDAFEAAHRKSLIVMATGAGKTRTVVALTDLLMRANRVKRVLFLADRVALVKQATNAFKTFLPGCNAVNLVLEQEEATSRVYVSTYPTIMGMIDDLKSGRRRFGPGHFDMVVIDEAHRSVYQKYGAIFDYFDSLLVGLTATPKSDIDKNTYRLFDLETGVPTAAYELEKAVAEQYLVPPRAISVPLKFQREGITYAELSEEDKEQWEELDWDEEGTVPDKVEAAALNQWLFNEDTVDKVLEHLMRHGQKVDGGDRLGKTILFAKNHNHAQFIQERFDINYPHLKGTFARVIDNQEKYAQSLIDAFSDRNSAPHLAISVDMLDTGIDVPEVLNLVFFKMVRSKTKFWQMIGRGTRLCKDIFGPGQHKEYFTVFDYCQNFEYFQAMPQGVEAPAQAGLSEKLFLRRLELLQEVTPRPEEPAPLPAKKVAETGGGYVSLAEDLATTLHKTVAAMNLNNFIVRPKRKYVETYSAREAWNKLSSQQAEEIADNLASLPADLDPEDITARQFDLLILNLQLAVLHSGRSLPNLQKQTCEIAALLEQKHSIPVVAVQMPLIQEIQSDEYWQDVTVDILEIARRRLRDLVKFIDRHGRKSLYTDFEDAIGAGDELVLQGLGTAIDVAQYKKKVQAFLRQHENEAVIVKLRTNVPLTAEDLNTLEDMLYNLGGEGTKEQFLSIYGQEQSLGKLVRSLVGLEMAAVQQAFATFLDTSRYNANQIHFVLNIIDYLTANGVMEPGKLYDQPFTYFSNTGVEGIFNDNDVTELIAKVISFTKNAA